MGEFCGLTQINMSTRLTTHHLMQRYVIFFSILMMMLVGSIPAYAQQRLARAKSDSLSFDARFKPFYHGVASGDPTQNSVILWTRVTPEDTTASVDVRWYIGTDTSVSNPIDSGTFSTDADRDFTVKVIPQNLQPGGTYYYYFQAMGMNSIVGRTKTLPSGGVDQLKFAVISCSNYEAGYFNAYGRIAERNDLDAVIHLGDYIYEYGAGVYGDSALAASGDRANVPSEEIITKADYRTRYSLYRLDPDLRRAHQQHPFITIWDDHESANDAYTDGAENHDSTEGAWSVRKQIAIEVYDEWLPITTTDSIYRRFQYGDLADLIMLDTRLEGRDEQILDVTDPRLYAPDRTLLGEDQKAWLKDQLANSATTWRLIGNQVIFSPFNAGFFAAIDGDPTTTPEALESVFLDIWDGYPAEREELVNFLDSNNIEDNVILTGDFHSTFGFDVALNPTDSASYNPETGAGAVAVEYATPSISAANFDENLGSVQTAQQLQGVINRGVPGLLPNPNPHMKAVDLIQHGYYIIDIKEDSVQGNWYFVNTLETRSDSQTYAAGYSSLRGTAHLRGSNPESAPKPVQDDPTPLLPKASPSRIEEVSDASGVVFGAYPNPARDRLLVHFGNQQTQEVRFQLMDLTGRTVKQWSFGRLRPGYYTQTLTVDAVPEGAYILQWLGGPSIQSMPVQVR